jgi:hypothetical protein
MPNFYSCREWICIVLLVARVTAIPFGQEDDFFPDFEDLGDLDVNADSTATALPFGQEDDFFPDFEDLDVNVDSTVDPAVDTKGTPIITTISSKIGTVIPAPANQGDLPSKEGEEVSEKIAATKNVMAERVTEQTTRNPSVAEITGNMVDHVCGNSDVESDPRFTVDNWAALHPKVKISLAGLGILMVMAIIVCIIYAIMG